MKKILAFPLASLNLYLSVMETDLDIIVAEK